MRHTTIIFGFGSLMYRPSLLATAPHATNVQPAYIEGFIRSFSIWDDPMCALDVARVSDTRARVNGVTFAVADDDLAALKRREYGYELIKVTAYHYNTRQPITHDCLVFSSHKNDGSYVFDGAAQQLYLENYLTAAKEYGDNYYQEILDTTFINGQKLRDATRLAASI